MKALTRIFGLTLGLHLMLTLPALAEEAGTAAEDVGFPQLKQSYTYPSQLFWLAVSFVVLYALMSKIALPAVGAVIEGRQAQRKGDLGQAEQMNDEASRVKTAYEQALAKAQRTATAESAAAERALSAKIAEEQAKFAEASRKRLSTAEQTIVQAKADALHSLSDIASDIAADIVEKVAGVQVNKADAKKAVTTAMQKG